MSKMKDESPLGRLALIPLSGEFLDASVNGDVRRAKSLNGWTIPSEWFEETDLIKMRIEDREADPLYIPWSLRAVVHCPSATMLGYIGFHSRPGAAYLNGLVPGGVEFGYAIFKKYRRQGYASQAIYLLIDWAISNYDIRSFVVSIASDNEISHRLARKIGFQQIGEREDPVDGRELVYVLQGEDLKRFIRMV